eukprot:m.790655 g.790655  ORF g.790655 m.790655 type:complete len:418 (+) comp59203_c1_seq5:606-1859(+)
MSDFGANAPQLSGFPPHDADFGLDDMAGAHSSSPPESGGEEDDGVWSLDIEEAFEEALAIYPPCGRKKIILSDEGKMFGRNELISRYILMKTGKHRSRKQVSSHIQVLARKKTKELTESPRGAKAASTTSADLSGLSSAQIVDQTITAERVAQLGSELSMAQQTAGLAPSQRQFSARGAPPSPRHLRLPPLATQRLAMERFQVHLLTPQTGMVHRMLYLSGAHQFVDPAIPQVEIPQIADKFPGLRELHSHCPAAPYFLVKMWADLAFDTSSSEETVFFLSNRFESLQPMVIEVASQVVTMGRPIAEKVVGLEGKEEGGRVVYELTDLPLCSFLSTLLHKLRSLPSLEAANRVLENFTAIQVVRDSETKDVLLCIAYAFELGASGCAHHSFQLVNSAHRPSFRRFFSPRPMMFLFFF